MIPKKKSRGKKKKKRNEKKIEKEIKIHFQSFFLDFPRLFFLVSSEIFVSTKLKQKKKFQ